MPNSTWAGEPGVFGSSEIEKKTRSRSRLEKKSGAGAAKKLAGSSALLEDEINVLFSNRAS